MTSMNSTTTLTEAEKVAAYGLMKLNAPLKKTAIAEFQKCFRIVDGKLKRIKLNTISDHVRGIRMSIQRWKEQKTKQLKLIVEARKLIATLKKKKEEMVNIQKTVEETSEQSELKTKLIRTREELAKVQKTIKEKKKALNTALNKVFHMCKHNKTISNHTKRNFFQKLKDFAKK